MNSITGPIHHFGGVGSRGKVGKATERVVLVGRERCLAPDVEKHLVVNDLDLLYAAWDWGCGICGVVQNEAVSEMGGGTRKVAAFVGVVSGFTILAGFGSLFISKVAASEGKIKQPLEFGYDSGAVRPA
jgi:hypothetical protein